MMMKKTLAAAVALSLFATAAIAQTAQPAPERPARVKLDANGDGVIDRAEAEKSPRLLARFDALDKNKDGKLDSGELRQREGHRGMRGKHEGHGHDRRGHGATIGGMHMRGPQAGGIERLDSDGDGRVSRAEFEAGEARHAERMRAFEQRRGERGEGQRAERPQPQRPTFAQLDSNGDGYIVRSEVAAWREAKRPQREAEMRKRFDERFAAADENKDGKLSRAEVEGKLPHLARRFAWMDDNRDGFLDKDELQPKHGR